METWAAPAGGAGGEAVPVALGVGVMSPTVLPFLAALPSTAVGLLADLIVRATKPAEQVPTS